MRKLVSGIIMVTFSLLVMIISVNAQPVKQHQPGQSLTITRTVELPGDFDISKPAAEFAYKITANTTLSKPGFSIVASANSANPKAKTLISEITSLKAGADACTDTTLLAPGASCTLYLKADFTKDVLDATFDDANDLTICPSTDPLGPQFDCASVPTSNRKIVKFIDSGSSDGGGGGGAAGTISVSTPKITLVGGASVNSSGVAAGKAFANAAAVMKVALTGATSDDTITPTARGPWAACLTFTPKDQTLSSGQAGTFTVEETCKPDAIELAQSGAPIEIIGANSTNAAEVTNPVNVRVISYPAGVVPAPLEEAGNTVLDSTNMSSVITYTNSNTEAVTLGAVKIQEGVAGQPTNFTVGTGCNAKTLEPGASCDVTLTADASTTAGVTVLTLPVTGKEDAKTVVGFEGKKINLERVQCPGEAAMTTPYNMTTEGEGDLPEKVCIKNVSANPVAGVNTYITDDTQATPRITTVSCIVDGVTTTNGYCSEINVGDIAKITMKNIGEQHFSVFGELRVQAQSFGTGDSSIPTYNEILTTAIVANNLGVIYPEYGTLSKGLTYTFRNEEETGTFDGDFVKVSIIDGDFLKEDNKCADEELIPKGECTISFSIDPEAAAVTRFITATPEISNDRGLTWSKTPAVTFTLGNAAVVAGQMRPEDGECSTNSNSGILAVETTTGMSNMLTDKCNNFNGMINGVSAIGPDGSLVVEYGDTEAMQTNSETTTTEDMVGSTPMRYVSVEENNTVGTKNEGGGVILQSPDSARLAVTDVEAFKSFDCAKDINLKDTACNAMMVATVGGTEHLYEGSYKEDPKLGEASSNGRVNDDLDVTVKEVPVGQATGNAADIKVATTQTTAGKDVALITVMAASSDTVVQTNVFTATVTDGVVSELSQVSQLDGAVNVDRCNGNRCYLAGDYTDPANPAINGAAEIDMTSGAATLEQVPNFISGNVHALDIGSNAAGNAILKIGGENIETTGATDQQLVVTPVTGGAFEPVSVSGCNAIATLAHSLTQAAPTDIMYTCLNADGNLVTGKTTGPTTAMLDNWLYHPFAASLPDMDVPKDEESASVIINAASNQTGILGQGK